MRGRRTAIHLQRDRYWIQHRTMQDTGETTRNHQYLVANDIDNLTHIRHAHDRKIARAILVSSIRVRNCTSKLLDPTTAIHAHKRDPA